MKNIIKVAIDSPAAAGAGTQAKALSQNITIFFILIQEKFIDLLGYLKIKYKKKFNYSFYKKKN